MRDSLGPGFFKGIPGGQAETLHQSISILLREDPIWGEISLLCGKMEASRCDMGNS